MYFSGFFSGLVKTFLSTDSKKFTYIKSNNKLNSHYKQVYRRKHAHLRQWMKARRTREFTREPAAQIHSVARVVNSAMKARDRQNWKDDDIIFRRRP